MHPGMGPDVRFRTPMLLFVVFFRKWKQKQKNNFHLLAASLFEAKPRQETGHF